MIYLLLAILCSAMISITMRLSSDRITGRISMLSVNYLTCLIISAAFTGISRLFPADPALPQTAAMGVIHGILYLSSFMLLQWNIRKNGVVLPAIFMKLGLLVPLAVSVLFFHEKPSLLQIAGFCIAVAAIILINYEKSSSSKGMSFSLILLLLLGGAGDAMSKIYEELCSADLSAQFLLYTFLTAFLLSALLVLHRKERPGRNEILFGFLIGIPNYFSAHFLLQSLAYIDAVIVYPTFSVTTIMIVTLAGVLFFREKLKKRQWAALAATLTALAMLNA